MGEAGLSFRAGSQSRGPNGFGEPRKCRPLRLPRGPGPLSEVFQGAPPEAFRDPKRGFEPGKRDRQGDPACSVKKSSRTTLSGSPAPFSSPPAMRSSLLSVRGAPKSGRTPFWPRWLRRKAHGFFGHCLPGGGPLVGGAAEGLGPGEGEARSASHGSPKPEAVGHGFRPGRVKSTTTCRGTVGAADKMQPRIRGSICSL